MGGFGAPISINGARQNFLAFRVYIKSVNNSIKMSFVNSNGPTMEKSAIEPDFWSVNNARSVLTVNCYQISLLRFSGSFAVDSSMVFLYFALHILPFNFQAAF